MLPNSVTRTATITFPCLEQGRGLLIEGELEHASCRPLISYQKRSILYVILTSNPNRIRTLFRPFSEPYFDTIKPQVPVVLTLMYMICEIMSADMIVCVARYNCGVEIESVSKHSQGIGV